MNLLCTLHFFKVIMHLKEGEMMENRIAELRKEKGLTLKQLGDILEIRDNTLSQYETGKRNPQLGLLQEIADFFDVSLEYLTKETNKRDYPANDEKDVIKIIKMLHSDEISIDNLSKITMLEVALWCITNFDYINEVYSEYSNTVTSLIHVVETEVRILKKYSTTRKQKNKTLEKIYDLLVFEDEISVSSENVLNFILEGNRIGSEKVNEVIEYMKKL